MLRIENQDRLAAIVSLSLALAVVPACNASAGHGLLRRPPAGAGVVTPQPLDQPYVVQRPVYPVPGTKPLFLNNYAGANYPSVLPGAVVTPTTFRMLRGQSRWSHRGGHAAGW